MNEEGGTPKNQYVGKDENSHFSLVTPPQLFNWLLIAKKIDLYFLRTGNKARCYCSLWLKKLENRDWDSLPSL